MYVLALNQCASLPGGVGAAAVPAAGQLDAVGTAEHPWRWMSSQAGAVGRGVWVPLPAPSLRSAGCHGWGRGPGEPDLCWVGGPSASLRRGW